MVLPKPQLTQERIYIRYPGFYGQESIQRHIRRYQWAMSHLSSYDIVLDAGCGSGYGSLILRQRCKAVVGIDRSPEAIHYAETIAKTERANGVRFLRGDLSQIKSCDLKHNLFDAIVCIEAIEHLDANSQKNFMEGVIKHLLPQGQLLMTTPIKGNKPRTKYHIKEFTPSELKNFLMPYFRSVTFDPPQSYHIASHFILAKCWNPLQRRQK